MKEGKLPPKMMGGVGGSSAPTTTMIQCSPTISSTSSRGASATQSSPVSSSTPSKQPSDEILSSLLRMNNFDSISSIKDESLDIDLSACVTISADPSGMIGGNSLSSSDFWKALDESAQTSQLDVSGGGVSGTASGGSVVGGVRSPPSPSPSSNNSILNTSDKSDLGNVVKKEQTDFSGTFLKPSCGITFSPLKRCIKSSGPEQLHMLKDKSPTRFTKLEGQNINGPPLLSPIIRLNQFPKPSVDVPRLNGNTNINTISSGTVTIKKESITTNEHFVQPPPLAALDCTVNKNEAAPAKIILEPLYKCLDCDVAFQDSQELANHNNHRIIYKCMECEREFDSEPSLKKHLKTHRPIDARKDAWKKCPDCGKWYVKISVTIWCFPSPRLILEGNYIGIWVVYGNSLVSVGVFGKI